MPLRSVFHFRPLLLSLITLSSCLTPNTENPAFDLFIISYPYLPYALVVTDLITGGRSMEVRSLTGAISSYTWWYLVHNEDAGRPGAEFARAPIWLRIMLDPREGSVFLGVGRILN